MQLTQPFDSWGCATFWYNTNRALWVLLPHGQYVLHRLLPLRVKADSVYGLVLDAHMVERIQTAFQNELFGLSSRTVHSLGPSSGGSLLASTSICLC